MGEASNDIRYRVLENWCLAHTGEKSSLEQATENLTQILNDHVIKKKMFFFVKFTLLINIER
jgi:hypothetical protein